MNTTNYLLKGNASLNFELLAKISSRSSPKTLCLTQEIHQLTPRYHPSAKTIREWTIYPAVGTVLSSYIFSIFSGAAMCVLSNDDFLENFLANTQKCLGQTMRAFESGQARIIGTLHACLVGLAAIGCYAGARYYFRDIKNEHRFNELRKEYCLVAEHLISKSSEARENHQEEALKKIEFTAKNLKISLPILKYFLREVAILNKNQAKIIISQLDHAINIALQKNGE